MDKPLDHVLKIPLSNGQAIIGFNKFGTPSIGFEHSENGWCLPYDCTVEEIWWLIQEDRQKGLRKKEVVKAITAMQSMIREVLDGAEVKVTTMPSITKRTSGEKN